MTRKSTSNSGIKALIPIGTASDPVTFWQMYSDLLSVTDR